MAGECGSDFASFLRMQQATYERIIKEAKLK